MVATLGDAVTLKGGLVVELRLGRARTTKDVNLRMLGSSAATRLRAAFEQTFAFRKTHAPPVAVPASLHAWNAPYAVMAREDSLRWPTLNDVTMTVQAFLNPVLAGNLDATGTRL